MTKAVRALTPKQLKVLEYWFAGDHMVESYRKAYPGNSNANTMRRNAYKFFHSPLVIEEIARRNDVILRRLDVTGEKVLAEMARIAFLDIRRIFNIDGTLKPIVEWSEDDARAIASFEVDEITLGTGADKITIGQSKKVKLYGKPEVLRTLAQYLKLIGNDDPVNKVPPQLVTPQESKTKEAWLEKYGSLPGVGKPN